MVSDRGSVLFIHFGQVLTPKASSTEWGQWENPLDRVTVGLNKVTQANSLEQTECRHREWTCEHGGEGEGGMN